MQEVLQAPSAEERDASLGGNRPGDCAEHGKEFARDRYLTRNSLPHTISSERIVSTWWHFFLRFRLLMEAGNAGAKLLLPDLQ